MEAYLQHKCFLAQQQQEFIETQTINLDDNWRSHIKEKCEKLLTDHTINSCIPLNSMHNQTFSDFVEFLINVGGNLEKLYLNIHEILPQIENIQHNVETRYTHSLLELKKQLQQIMNCGYAITCNFCSDDLLNCTFLAVTIHFVMNAQLFKRMLRFKCFSNTKIIDINTTREIEQILVDFNLSWQENCISIIKTTKQKNLLKFSSNYKIVCINELVNSALKQSILPEIVTFVEIARKDKKEKIKSTDWRQIYNNLLEINVEHVTKLDTVTNINSRDLLELLKILKQCQQSLESLSSETTPTLYLVYIHLHRVKNLCALHKQELPLIRCFKEVLGNKLNSIIVNDLHLLHKIALFLFPPANKLLQFSANEKEKIKNSCKEYILNFMPTTELSNKIVTENNDLYADFIQTVDHLTPAECIDAELQNYINQNVRFHDNFDVLNWWHLHKSQYNYLYQLSCLVLATPATCVATDNIFINARKLIDNARNESDSTIVDKILYLNYNK